MVKELIRRKIENLSFAPGLTCGETLRCTRALSEFYEKRQFATGWTPALSKELLKALEHAENEGLNPLDYHYHKLQSFSEAPPSTPLMKAEFEMLQTDAYLLYASHLLCGKVNPETTDPQWHVSRREGDPVASLQNAMRDSKLYGSINELIPSHNTYRMLRGTLALLRKANPGSWPTIQSASTIKKGTSDANIPAIRNRLILLGDLHSREVSKSAVYDEALQKGIEGFQKRHGLDNDGNIGQKTLEALNLPIDQRIEQVMVNMERWRWLPQEFGDYYVTVNIASFELQVVKNHELLAAHKVMVGKPARQTPVMSSRLQYLVFNPTWTVPPGILNKDILPAVRKDVAYLSKKRLQVLDAKGNVVDPSTIDWNSNSVKAYTYRQPAGPDNALGAVKFIFANKFNVYIHDTPSKELFGQTERAFSSGCIRVERPLELAELLLESPSWNSTKIREVIKGGVTQTVHLPKQPNVHLLYWTAWIDHGILQFRKDIYERDKAVLEGLQKSA